MTPEERASALLDARPCHLVCTCEACKALVAQAIRDAIEEAVAEALHEHMGWPAAWDEEQRIADAKRLAQRQAFNATQAESERLYREAVGETEPPKAAHVEACPKEGCRLARGHEGEHVYR